jgi:hypothetical protein
MTFETLCLFSSVMPALVAGIHVLQPCNTKTWMAGTSPAMTNDALPLVLESEIQLTNPSSSALICSAR